MRIVIGVHTLAAEGGMVSYAATVADQLQRAGHDVLFYGETSGKSAETLSSLGIRTVVGRSELPESADIVYAQDLPSSLDLLAAMPEVPQVFAWHSAIFDINQPPQIPDAVRLMVLFFAHDPGRHDALAVQTPTIRLAQPIDLQRFQPARPLAADAIRAVAIGNYLSGERRDALVEACRIAGVELTLLGAREERMSTAPEHDMNAADIVFAKGRTAMEAMACGRAVYVYDEWGCDGWVTPDRFEFLMSSGMNGTATTMTADAEAVAADLALYAPAMGGINRDLATATFNAAWHVGALVKAFDEIAGGGAPAPDNANAFELARLSRLAWRHESDAFELRARMAGMDARVAAEHARYEQARGEAIEAERRLAAVVNSTRWRTLNLLLSPLDRARRRG